MVESKEKKVTAASKSKQEKSETVVLADDEDEKSLFIKLKNEINALNEFIN